MQKFSTEVSTTTRERIKLLKLSDITAVIQNIAKDPATTEQDVEILQAAIDAYVEQTGDADLEGVDVGPRTRVA